MGTIHILEGADHLLFVFALLLIVTGLVSLFKAVTAFTVAHSITLFLATLGMIKFPGTDRGDHCAEHRFPGRGDHP